MTLLIDTHAFLWFIGGDDRLADEAREAILNPANTRLLSVAALWEMSIKAGLGRLDVPLPFTRLVREHVEGNATSLLPIRAPHLDALVTLPLHHRDPFDRLMIVQAQTLGATLVSRDEKFDAYSVSLLKA